LLMFSKALNMIISIKAIAKILKKEFYR